MLRIFGILNLLQADDPADEEEPPDDFIPDVNQPLQNQEDNEDTDSNSDSDSHSEGDRQSSAYDKI